VLYSCQIYRQNAVFMINDDLFFCQRKEGIVPYAMKCNNFLEYAVTKRKDKAANKSLNLKD